MGISVGVGLEIQERLTLLGPGGRPQFLTVERHWIIERVDGDVVPAIIPPSKSCEHVMIVSPAQPEQPLIRWENPFAPCRQGHGRQWHDDEIGVAGCIASLLRAVREDGELRVTARNRDGGEAYGVWVATVT